MIEEFLEKCHFLFDKLSGNYCQCEMLLTDASERKNRRVLHRSQIDPYRIGAENCSKNIGHFGKHKTHSGIEF